MLFLIFSLSPSVTVAQRVGSIKVTPDNARQYRDSLIHLIFGPSGFPYDILPDSTITNVRSIDYCNDFPYSDMIYPSGNLDSIDNFVVTVDSNSVNFPSKTSIYLFHPHNSNGKLFIYHSGHCAGSAIVEDVYNNANRVGNGIVIPRLIDSGYTVLAVPMINYKNRTRSGYFCGYNNHNQLFADSLYSYPLGLFFKPLIAALNQLGRNNFPEIYMMGLSGGGWTTSVYPAMDSTISMSFPVAGSWPMAIRNIYYSDGDAEQYYPPLFKNLLDYHELYTLSCLAPSRKMLQINNRYDACCFNGAFQHIFYVDSVAKALEGSGGEFKYYLDETSYRHVVSPRTIKVILKFIDENHPSLVTTPEDTSSNSMPYYYSIQNNFSVQDPGNLLSYSMLKSPNWMYLNYTDGNLSGQLPPACVLPLIDTVSFKVEDSSGRFVIYNYKLFNKRDKPYFFTTASDSQTVYFLPFFSRSMTAVNQLSKNYFFFNNPSLSVNEIAVLNNSLVKLKLNTILSPTDSIGYNGYSEAYPIKYSNGMKIENFGLTYINLNGVKNNYALAGMIRFNTDSGKFEYFNGTSWINMNQ